MLNNAINTTSEQWRHSCETRFIAAMKSDDQRRLFLQGVRQKRGEEAWKRLRGDVWRQMKRVA